MRAVYHSGDTQGEIAMAKDKKTKHIPKRIAGMKLPKAVRRKGEALIEAVGSPAGREVIAKGLTIAATLAAAAAARGQAVKAGEAGQSGDASQPGQSGEGTAPASPPIDPAKMVEAVSTVADAVLGRIFGAKRPG